MPSCDASEVARVLDETVSQFARELASSADARRELSAVFQEYGSRRVRLRGVLRNAASLSPAVARATLRRLAMLLERGDASFAEALVNARLHRQILDRAARAVWRSDASYARVHAAWRTADRARSHLVTSALSVATGIARKYVRRGIELEDLVQEGTIGLMRAADMFDPRQGCPFGAYAAFWVRQQIRRALVEHTRTIRVPLHVVEANGRVERVRQAFTRKHGRAPSGAELLDATRVTPATLSAALSMEPEPLRLHAPSPRVPDLMLLDHLTDGAPLADEKLAHASFGATLRRSLETLPSRDREVLRLRFGIDEGEHSLQEIGDRYGVGRERIRRIEARALRTMRATAEELAGHLAA